MNNNEILDAPDKIKRKEPDKWKSAIVSIIILSSFFAISIFSLNTEQFFIENIGILASLYLFIKKVKIKNLKHGQFFLWCNLIVFSSFMITHLLESFFLSVDHISFSSFIFSSFIYLLKSILNGYILGLGVYSAITLRTGVPIAFAILISGFFTIDIIQNL